MGHNQPVIEDAIIIGAGPGGLITAEALRRRGVSCRVHEKGPIAGNIAQYPAFMRFFSTKQNLELADFPMQCTDEKPTRAEYLAYLAAFARYHALPIETYSEVLGANREPSGVFRVTVRRHGRGIEEHLARTIVAAPGAWEHTRRLGAAGEDLPKVHRRFTEPHPYIGREVMVVGGANSAVETALILQRAGAHVTICHRGANFHHRSIKYWLRPDIENRIAKGEIHSILRARVVQIGEGSVTIKRDDGTERTIPNDFVLPMIGYDPPVALLQSLGITVDPETLRPSHDPASLESNVPGIYVCGVILAGNVSGGLFIENIRHHGEQIAASIAARLVEDGQALRGLPAASHSM